MPKVSKAEAAQRHELLALEERYAKLTAELDTLRAEIAVVERIMKRAEEYEEGEE